VSGKHNDATDSGIHAVSWYPNFEVIKSVMDEDAVFCYPLISIDLYTNENTSYRIYEAETEKLIHGNFTYHFHAFFDVRGQDFVNFTVEVGDHQIYMYLVVVYEKPEQGDWWGEGPPKYEIMESTAFILYTLKVSMTTLLAAFAICWFMYGVVKKQKEGSIEPIN